MTSRVDIINGAAIKLGVQRIQTPADPSELARTASTVWSRLAKAELRKNAWSFALTSTSLGRLPDPVGGQYGSAYQLPTDLIRIVQFNDSWVIYGMSPVTDGSGTPYSIEGRTLLAHDQTARIRYVRDLSEDTALWDAAFVEAFTCKLAMELGPTLTKDKQKVRDAAVEYKQALWEAKRTNAIELPPAEIPDSSWVTARFGQGGSAGYRPISPVPNGGDQGQPYDFEALVED